MAINFPTSLDNFTNPASGNTLDSPSHSLQHSDINDAVEALEAKVGIGASPAGSATAGQVLTAQGGGTALWATPSAGGLVLIGSTSFTSQTSVSVNNVFTSTYDNYYIEIDFTQGSTNDAWIKLRASGTDKTTNYTNTGTSLNGTTLGSYGTGTTTLIYILQPGNAVNFCTINIARPNISGPTVVLASASRSSDSVRYINTGGQTENYQADGFTFFTGASSTGKIKVFGVKQ